jgi:hypothetical protein
MIGDIDHYDRRESVAFRLFALQPDHALHDVRLHGVPVPWAIPPERWLRTTIRVQHLGGLTAERREARWAKYQEVDPEHRWEPDYEYTRAPVQTVLRWPARPLDEPVVHWPDQAELDEGALAALDLDGPVLSVALIDGPTPTGDAVAVLRALADEPCDEPVELLVVTSDEHLAREIEQAVPTSVVLRTSTHSSGGARRNAAIRTARGDYIAFFTPDAKVQPGVLAALLEAHEGGAGLVRGRPQLDSSNPTHRAALLLEAASLPRPGSAVDLLPEPCGSFFRQPLLDAGGFDEEAAVGLDALAARRLTDLGFEITSVPTLTFTPSSPPSTALQLARQRFELGRIATRLWREQRPVLRAPITMLRSTKQQLRQCRAALAHQQLEPGAPNSKGVPTRLLMGAAATWAGATYETLRGVGSR